MRSEVPHKMISCQVVLQNDLSLSLFKTNPQCSFNRTCLVELEMYCRFMDLPGGLSMRRGSSERKNAIVSQGRKSTQTALQSLMRSPDFENERPIVHITQWQSASTARTVLYLNISHCNKIAMRFSFSACVLQCSRNSSLRVEL